MHVCTCAYELAEEGAWVHMSVCKRESTVEISVHLSMLAQANVGMHACVGACVCIRGHVCTRALGLVSWWMRIRMLGCTRARVHVSRAYWRAASAINVYHAYTAARVCDHTRCKARLIPTLGIGAWCPLLVHVCTCSRLCTLSVAHAYIANCEGACVYVCLRGSALCRSEHDRVCA